ncbi:hypothetical protein PMAYCL1PPCAC_31579 [Pristionchus mayeri]|uniref:Uncharacterized protein n=1 Tax=Pristionchus mayeri TaxID=1317129 RepID=A0AAN5DE06_9BILA|nr:hypothetical protein PMAYCL1PPCAC_31579 [Pristionchus mayeri]
MSSRSRRLEERNALKNMAGDVVNKLGDQEQLQAKDTQEDDPHLAESEMRHSVRTLKEPQRLDASFKPRTMKRRRKIKIEDFEFEMEPVPPNLRSILRPKRQDTSTTLEEDKGISKKRKVRLSRSLQYELITPLPGWRPDHTRMPEDSPSQKKKKQRASKKVVK